MQQSRPIAFFDFDGTLIKGDSLWLFLQSLVGTRQALMAFALSLAEGIRTRAQHVDLRTAIKTAWLGRLMKDRASDYVRDLIRRDRARVEKIKAMQALVTAGLESGVSPLSMDDLLVEARRRAAKSDAL